MPPKSTFPRLALCLLSSTLALAGVCPAAPADAPARPSGHPVERLFNSRTAGRNLIVLDWDREAVRRAARRRGRFLVPGFPLPQGDSIDLELEPFSVTGPASRFVIGRKAGPDLLIDFDPASISLFRGRVAGLPHSSVFLSFSERRSSGFIDPGTGGRRYRISSRGAEGRELVAGGISVFSTGSPAARPPDVPLCEARPASEPATDSVSIESSGPIKGLMHLQLAVDTDYEYFILFGDVGDALDYLIQVYAEVSAIYMRDVDTRIEISFARIWDDPDDLFNDVNPSPLGDFRNYWNANMSSVTRDAAQLLSGRRDYPYGGEAYLSALCGTEAYSVVGYAMGFFPDPSRPSPYAYDIDVTAHELGHVAGTEHTHESPNLIDTCDDPLTTPQRGTIMSYCSQTWSGMNAVGDLYFHSRIQQNMDAHIGSRICIVHDCNQNGVADSIDVQTAASQDLNMNGRPDECEDCNSNLVLDDADIGSMASQDVNGNGIPDECEPDCNGNAVPDSKDIADGTSTDLYGNDIPDECETDCNANGVSDYSEIQADMTLDIDRDAALDSCQDCDTDGTTDLDLLGRSHHAWVASGHPASSIRRFHAPVGVESAVSGGGAGALAGEAQDLLISPDGFILVSSKTDSRVMKFDLDGLYLGDLVPPGAGGLSAPAGLTVTPDGATLLVASSGTGSVLAYDLMTGASQGAFVPAGAGGLSGPFGMAFGPDGNLYVASGSNEILEYDGQNGSFAGVLVGAAANGGLDQPRGIAFKPDGNLLVASFGTNQVLEFLGETGTPMGRWAKSGTATVLTLVSPWGIRIGANGNVFVSRTGEDGGSGAGGSHQGQLHLSSAQIYEFDIRNGNFLRTYVGGNDHGLDFATGFDFMPGWTLDCNLNQLPDSCDISSGLSQDLDMSATPDECETDCNFNGAWDRLEIIPYGNQLDCNFNHSPDTCDLSSGLSQDCTANGIPDECESDCNGNQIADSCDISAGTSSDCNGNGVPDECDYWDDLEAPSGWTVGASGDTATSGIWIRVDPVGSAAQPEDDHTPGIGTNCFVTGQGAPGATIGLNDVDGGATTLVSPVMDLSSDPEAVVGYWRWYSNHAAGNPGQDVFVVDITNNGGLSWFRLETVGPTGPETMGGWFYREFRVADLLPPTSNVKLRFVASDNGGESNIEAAVDDLVVITGCCHSHAECTDGLACTIDTCNVAGTCQNMIVGTKCLISGTCYDDGQVNPVNGCEECDASSPTSWSGSSPEEVAGVNVTQTGATQVAWQSQGTGIAYDVLGGDGSDLLLDGGIGEALCLADDQGASFWDDTRPDPAPGQAYYYLIRSQKACGSGTYGLESSGLPRAPLVDCL